MMGRRRCEFEGVGIPRAYGYEEMDVYGVVHVDSIDQNKSTVEFDS
jgi:hypothetical protein